MLDTTQDTGAPGMDSRPVQRAAPKRDYSNAIIAGLLVVIMLLAGFFRYTGLNWDDFVRFHPDERFLTVNLIPRVGQGILTFTPNREPVDVQRQRCLERYPDTAGLGGYFDAQCSDWNPHNVGEGLYVYGTLPLFIARVTADAVVDITGNPTWGTSTGIHIVWRALSATADMLVVLIVFGIGHRLHGKWVGLLAAALYAFAVFPIQQAHFGTTDAMSNLFTMLAVFFAVRVQDRGKPFDYAGFGLAFGMAMASRINILPVVGLVIVAAFLRMLPAFAGGTVAGLRDRSLVNNLAGLVFAGVLSIVTFRILNPYAFTGPGFFGLGLNPRWLDDIETARHLVSGNADSPPNFQWVGRVDYLFPLNSMVTWGLGLALGITAVGAWFWSGWRVLRGRPGAMRNLLLFGWILVYFGWLGGNWVASMRYFLPLYGPLAILAAWALVEVVKRSQATGVQWRRVAAYGLTAFVTGFTLLWAAMFTNIYREPATFVQASQWVWENVPGDFYMQPDDAPDGAPLLNVAITNRTINDKIHPISTLFRDQAGQYQDGIPYSGRFYASYNATVTEVNAPYLGDPLNDPDDETVTVMITPIGEPNTVLASGTLVANLTIPDDHQIGQSYTIPLEEPFEVEAGRTYELSVQVAGGPVIGGGSVMGVANGWDETMPAKVCTIPDGLTLMDDGPAPLAYSNDCDRRYAWEGLINYASTETQTEDSQTYHLVVDGDQATDKRERLLTILDNADYILIQTNRRYDSHARNPLRWPLTNAYYDALFNEELGFELAAMFQETFELGPLRVSDQHLPIYDSPAWLNEFEPEEAFHVYDHPVVFIFQKTADYTPEQARAILYGVPLQTVGSVAPSYDNPVVYDLSPSFPSIRADESPTQLMMTDTMRETQYEGGTWSERFDTDSFVNSSQMVTVVLWWLLLVVIGWVTFPLLYVLLPGLADRGYAVAKYAGMLLLGWGTWVLASMRLPVWSQAGLWLALAVVGALGVTLVWRKRGELVAYVRGRWRTLLWIELFSFGLFVFFVFIRLTNPDLWVVGYGGEKPMDFAYFNAILRSTVFPAIDPWFAGGYINYYYFGFVIVGVPTLMLGVIPAIAYNLAVPTIASATGMAAFSLAYNVVSAWRVREEVMAQDGADATVDDASARPRRRPLGNPWLAGIAALSFAVLLGNLDTPRVFARGVAEMGGYEIPQGLQHYYQSQLEDEYVQEYGVLPPPNSPERFNIQQEAMQLAQGANLLDEFEYEVHKVMSLVGGFGSGMVNMLGGQQLRISPDRWFWAPSRVISEVPEVGGMAITEMPFFTFLYGDLHAHMIAMPLILLAAAFVFNELMLAKDNRRGFGVTIGSLALGAIAVGMSQAVNTWDWPTLMILSGAGLSYAWFLRWWKRDDGFSLLSRRAVLDALVRIGGFFAMTFIAAMPYTMWFATGFTELLPWNGGSTRIWSYLTIHGLFLLFIVSLLIWETARWFRTLHVRDLKGRAPLVLLVGFGFALAWLLAVIFFFRGERIMLVALPLTPWIALLFFRPQQSRAMRYVLVLAGLSLCITMGVEFYVLSGDNGRQNMVFKFYMQVWLFFSVAAGAALAWLLSGIAAWRPVLRNTFYAVSGVLIFAAALYPVVATQGKAAFRMADNVPVTLNGMEFLRYADDYWESGLTDPVDMIHDYEIIRFMQEEVEGSPVIIEAQSGLVTYQWGARIAMFTGLPTVMGWDNHQRQQRSLAPMPQMVNQRTANVNAFFTTTNIRDAERILRHYGVEYVILGAYEQSRYRETGGLEKFDVMEASGLLEEVFSFEYEGVTSRVYRVNQSLLESIPVALSGMPDADDPDTMFELEVPEQ